MLYNARIKEDLYVEEMIEGNEWIWHANWYSQSPFLLNVKVPELNDEDTHKVNWKNKKGQMVELSISIAWNDMRDQSNKVEWWKLIWEHCERCCNGFLRTAFKGEM
ncbi:hypothetical protein Tco_0568572 [Tanacetum coccineum]